MKNTTLKLLSVISLALLTACGTKHTSTTKTETTSSATASSEVSETPTSTPMTTPEQTETVSENSDGRTTALTGLISLVVPEGWEIVPDGFDSPYELSIGDRLILRKGDSELTITASLESYPNGIGGDPYTEGFETVGKYTYQLIRNADYSGGQEELKVDETSLSLAGGGYLSCIFDDYGILDIQYTNPNGAYLDDIRNVLETLKIEDSYGTATVLVDNLNIRSDADASSESRGVAKKGKTYKVRAIQGDGQYTWYAIGYTKELEKSGGSFDWIADEDGDWVTFQEGDLVKMKGA